MERFFNLKQQVDESTAKVQFTGIFETENGEVSLLGFKAGQKLDPHVAPAEVMVYVVEGEIEFTMAGKPNLIRE